MKKSSETEADHGALTVKQFCAFASVSHTTTYEELAAGRLTAKKKGRKTLILRSEAARWLASLPELQAVPKQAAA